MNAQVIAFPERGRTTAARAGETRSEWEARLDRIREPSEWSTIVARIMAARPDLNESAAITCANDIDAGRSTFEAVVNGEPVTEDAIRALIELQRAWKDAEAAFKQAVADLSRRSGRKPKAIAHLMQHVRAGHQLRTGAG